MSHLTLKLVALAAMTIDHIGLVYGQQGWNMLPIDSSAFRWVGRMAFPLFAFCLAQGWKQTSHRGNYFINLVLGALVSQIPFTMAFSAQNLQPAQATPLRFQISAEYLLLAGVVTLLYRHFTLSGRLHYRLGIVAAAAFLPGIQLQIHGVWIAGRNGNVFFTFVLAFLCLYLLSEKETLSRRDRSILALAAAVFLLVYGLHADYGTGLSGIILIAGFTFLNQKGQQIAFLIFWSFWFYAILAGNFESAVACALAGLFLAGYSSDRQNKYRMKKLFYWYYPIHLLVLGGLNVMMML